MLEKIGSALWSALGVIAGFVWLSVAVGLMTHLIRYAWSAF